MSRAQMVELETESTNIPQADREPSAHQYLATVLWEIDGTELTVESM
jgi:hypothetical protein